MRTLLFITTLAISACCIIGCTAPRAPGRVQTVVNAESLDSPTIIHFEAKYGRIYITCADGVGDAHMFELDYSRTGLTKKEVLARLRKNVEKRKISNKTLEATSQ